MSDMITPSRAEVPPGWFRYSVSRKGVQAAAGMFLILAGPGLDPLNELQWRFAVAALEGAAQGDTGEPVVFDRVDQEVVCGDVIEGSDDDHCIGFEAVHLTSPKARGTMALKCRCA